MFAFAFREVAPPVAGLGLGVGEDLEEPPTPFHIEGLGSGLVGAALDGWDAKEFHTVAMLPVFAAAALAGWVEAEGHIYIGEVFQTEGEDHAEIVHVFAGVATARVIDDAEAGDPAREIAVDFVALGLEQAIVKFILLAEAESPVVVEAEVAADIHEGAVLKEHVVIKVTVPDVELHAVVHKESGARIHLVKACVEDGHLAIEREADPRERRPAQAVHEIAEGAAIRLQTTEVRRVYSEIYKGI